jgi:mannose-6-phosphate isomerase-like protein (cupin superfamily)
MTDTSSANTIHDPLHGTTMTFRHEGGDVWIDAELEPGAHLPEHFHPSLEEHWEVVDGEARVKLDRHWRTLTAADGPVVVHRNVRHELRNDSSVPVHTRTFVTPAGRLEEFLTEAARGAREGLLSKRDLPTGLKSAGWIARLALDFRDETVMCSPPPAVQKVVLPLMARLGR